MAASQVAKCRNLCFFFDITRGYQFRILSNQKLTKLKVRQWHRHLCTGRGKAVWAAVDTPDQALYNAQGHKRLPELVHGEVTVDYYRGLPQVTVPLPSRRERCRFTLRPITNTVGDFMAMVCAEDHGIDHIAVSTAAGVRIASSNTVEALMEDDFRLVINDICYHVATPKQERLSLEELERLSDVKNLIHQLYEALNVEEHQLKKERELCGQLEELKVELEPMEQKRLELHSGVERHTNMLTWVGLGLMSVQFGILARLTWWEYSWDIMEPVTYFVTYGTAMAAYAYYVLTKQEYVLPEVKDRQYLITLHKRAKKIGLDLNRYNHLKEEVYNLERDLRRLRDPLQVHLPPHHLANSLKKTSNPFAKAFSLFQKKPKTKTAHETAAVESASSKETPS